MQVQRVQNNNPAFGIKISEGILKAADSLYCDRPKPNQQAFNRIYRKAKYMEENYGFDDYTIVLKEEKRKNKLMSILYLEKNDNSKSIPLIMKDGLNKLLTRFNHINQFELKNTINGTYKLKNW